MSIRAIVLILSQVVLLAACQDEQEEFKKREFAQVSPRITGKWGWLFGGIITENGQSINFASGDLNDCGRVDNLFFAASLTILPNEEELQFEISSEDLCTSETRTSIWKLVSIDSDGRFRLTEQTATNEVNQIILFYSAYPPDDEYLSMEQTGDFINVNPKPRFLSIFFHRIE